MKKISLFFILTIIIGSCGKDPIVYPIVLKLDKVDVSNWKVNVMTSATNYTGITFSDWDKEEEEELIAESLIDLSDIEASFEQLTLSSENEIAVKNINWEPICSYIDKGAFLEISYENEPYFNLDINKDKTTAALTLLTIAYKKAGAKDGKVADILYSTPTDINKTINQFISDKKLAKNDTLIFWHPTYHYKKS
jgi:hypothetical protein